MDDRLEKYRWSDVQCSLAFHDRDRSHLPSYGSESCQPPLFSSVYRPENRTFNIIIPLSLGFVHTSDFRRFMGFVCFFREIRQSYISLHPAYTFLFLCSVNFQNPYFSVSTAPRSAFKKF